MKLIILIAICPFLIGASDMCMENSVINARQGAEIVGMQRQLTVFRGILLHESHGLFLRMNTTEKTLDMMRANQERFMKRVSAEDLSRLKGYESDIKKIPQMEADLYDLMVKAYIVIGFLFAVQIGFAVFVALKLNLRKEKA